MELSLLLAFALLAAPVAAAAATGSTFDPEALCLLATNGTKMNDPRHCNTWVQCIDGLPVSGSCGASEFYDRETQACVPSGDVKCLSSDPCAALPNGFAADPYSCNGYYYCRNGTGTRGECNTGLNYNPGTEACIRDYPCGTKPDPDALCNILADGVIIKDASSCAGYELCWRGVEHNENCPAGFYYSASLGACDYEQNVECAHTPAPPATAAPDECPEAGSFISDGSTCNGYYYCHESAEGQMLLEHGVCADGRFFDAASGGACVPRTAVRCAYDRCVNMGNSSIQLANLSDDGCTGYAICQHGKLIGEGACPAGEYFDELTQLCTQQIVSFAACALSHSTVMDERTTATATATAPAAAAAATTTTRTATPASSKSA
ncbi:hypothetical protein KR222_011851 [Zaprionus bogoriensis]|nr:hypothetical protein KR222_011851 [Zaprionus bogoriensis]